jgi:hypothetical protein
LEQQFAESVPRAWRDVLVNPGISAESINTSASVEEVAALSYRLDHAESALHEWTLMLRQWISSTSDGDVQRGISGTRSVPLAGLERRYELLLRLTAIDRQPVLHRTAASIRETARRHGVAIAAGRPLRYEQNALDALVPESNGMTISSDELCKYIDILRELVKTADNDR